jgi:hypothetical protein
MSNRAVEFKVADDTPKVIVIGHTTQTANVFEVQQSDTTKVLTITDSGSIKIGSSQVTEIVGESDGFTIDISSVSYLDLMVVSGQPVLSLLSSHATEGGQIVIGRGTGYSTDWSIDVYEERLRFFDGSTEMVTINNSGQMGIGTDTPDVTLTVKQTGGNIVKFVGQSSLTTHLFGATGQFSVSGQTGNTVVSISNSGAGGYLNVGSGALYVEKSGEVVVGSTSALGTLTVYGHDDTEETIVIQAAASQSANILSIQTSATTELLTLSPSGELFVKRDGQGGVYIYGNGNGGAIRPTSGQVLQLEGESGIDMTLGAGSGGISIGYGYTNTTEATMAIFAHTTSKKVLLVKASASHSGSVFEIQDSTASKMVYVIDELDGRLVVGTANSVNAKIETYYNSTNIPSSRYGGYFRNIISMTEVSSNVWSIGVSGDVSSYTGYAANNNLGGIVAFSGSASFSGTSNQGTVAYSRGASLYAGVSSCGTGFSVTNVQGLYIEISNVDADATITNAYGIYLKNSDATGTITNRYGIYQVGDDATNFFEGDIGIGTTSPGSTLTLVRASADVAIQMQRTGTGAETVTLQIDGDSNYRQLVTGASDQIFYTNNTERMRIDSAGDIHFSGNLDLSASSYDILMVDNAGAALEFKQGSDLYLRFVTTNAGEQIEFNKTCLFGAISTNSITMTSGSFVIPTSTPSSASDTGTQGKITWDASYVYVCTATDTWKRASIATW